MMEKVSSSCFNPGIEDDAHPADRVSSCEKPSKDAAGTKPSTIHFIACSVERTTDHESKPQLLVIPQIKVKPGSNGSRPQILLVVVFQTSIKKTKQSAGCIQPRSINSYRLCCFTYHTHLSTGRLQLFERWQRYTALRIRAQI